jgi:multicomponent Na+:H+ antiporter subunit B
MAIAVNHVILAMMCALALGIVMTRSALNAILLMSVYSLAMAVWMMAMDAPDVAFTEAAVGAGVSTLILLGAWLTIGERAPERSGAVMAAAVVGALLCAAIMIAGAASLPALGDPFSPANAGVGRAYVESSPSDTGIPNVVTAVLASYRGFDTFGETSVILAAGVGVSLLLGGRAGAPRSTVPAENRQVVLSIAARLLVPLILLFAFYVLFHGDLGAGGGFQAGVIVAAAFCLHGLVFGRDALLAALPETWVRAGASVGILIYGVVGAVCMINGGAFLDYDFLFGPGVGAATTGQHFGVLGIEIGVCVTVACVMTSLFYAFAGRSRPDGGGAE